MPQIIPTNEKMLYIIQNDPDVPPGLIQTELERLEVKHVLLKVYQDDAIPDPAATAAVIVLGGSMGAHDDVQHPFLAELKKFIREVVAREIPYLGVCLGGQLLAAAMGAEVASNAYDEKGNLSATLTDEGSADTLFDGIPTAFATFQWHDDSFSIPSGGIRLAFSAACRNQAFRIGPNARGLQFHPEVDPSIVAKWSAGTAETAARQHDFIAAYHENEIDYRAVTRKMVENFTSLAGLRESAG